MNSLEIPKSELMNYLPYSVIEEVLEFSPIDLVSDKKFKKSKESRILSYSVKKNPKKFKVLESLLTSFDFEKEVLIEINKILHNDQLVDAFFDSLKTNSFKATNLAKNQTKDNLGSLE